MHRRRKVSAMNEPRRHTPDMGEISGFGGTYEAKCQAMLEAGMAWFEQHPDAEPRFKGSSAIFGVVLEDNDDAKALTETIVTAADHDLTGAMHHAVIARLLWIKQNGWERYCEEMRKQHAEEDGQ